MFEVKVKYKTAAKEGREAVSSEDVEEEQRHQTSLEDKENVHRIKENKCKAKARSSFPGAHAGCADPLLQVVAAALPEDALWDPAAWGERVGSRARVRPPSSPCIGRDFV